MISPLNFAEQPILRLSLQNSRCVFVLRINDVPVFQNRNGSAGFLEMPINEWVFQGENIITIELLPCGEDPKVLHPLSRIELVGYHKKRGMPLKSRQEVGRFSFTLSDDGKYLLPPGKEMPGGEDSNSTSSTGAGAAADPANSGKPAGDELHSDTDSPAWTNHGVDQKSTTGQVKATVVLKLPVSWPAAPWKKFVPIPPDQAALYSLKKLTENLRHLAERKDVGTIEKILETKCRGYESAFHLWNQNAMEFSGVKQRLLSPKCIVEPFPESMMVLRGAGNLIATLVDEKSQRSAIKFTEAGQPDFYWSIWWGLNQSTWVAVA